MSLEDFGWRVAHCSRLHQTNNERSFRVSGIRSLPVMYDDPTAVLVISKNQILNIICPARNNSAHCGLDKGKRCDPIFTSQTSG